jgi:hypothetical protein
VLFSSCIVDSAWIIDLPQRLLDRNIDYRLYLFWVRISWGFFAIQYQALALFIESLIQQQVGYTIRQKLFTAITGGFFLFALGLAIIDFNCLRADLRPELEFIVRAAENLYLLGLLMPLSLIIVIWKLRTITLPKILKEQLNTLIPGLIVPFWIFDILQMFPFEVSPTWATNSFAAATLSTSIITIAFFYCSRKIVSLRFLNFNTHVQSSSRFNFIDGFKDVLEQLSHTTSVRELLHITQTLFKEAFDIPLNKTKLYVRKLSETELESQEQLLQVDHRIVETVESFISTQAPEVLEHIATSKILIHDEVAFSNFYEQTMPRQSIVGLLETIEADILLPIYEKKNLIAYIVVERNARNGRLYGNVEHDEMLVFAGYVANIINLLQSRNLKLLLQQEKDLREELYHKHQEINQYRESIRSFLRASNQKEIGIIFFKRNQFVFGNKAAKSLVHVNINTQEGHPFTKALKSIVKYVQEYKTPYSSVTLDKDGNRLVLAGVPNLEQNNVIITIYYPEISDIVKKQLDVLRDPSNWDYLLYLETTTSGKLINQLIPSSSETFVNFKIELLKIALSKKALLLDMAEGDLMPTVEILHHISLRETLYVLKLQTPSRTSDTAIKLFGINPILGVSTAQPPLLEQLNAIGTLFIQNIHLLDLETQEHLAEFIKYGFYRIFKSDQRMSSSVRIIASSHQNLAALVQEGLFSKALFTELKNTALSMPSLLTLPEHELSGLADGLIEQIVTTQDLKNLLELNDKDYYRITHHGVKRFIVAS